uniref:Protein kinase domain-containing protein n=1 Tax=Fagus sylvatica TaxID=28930 RepID=A0A2N9FXN7_FAGSY
MEQFRHIGEVLGSLKALMVLQDDIQFNPCQCRLLVDIFCLGFNTIAEEIRQNLKLEEKNTKWKALEQPLRELYRVFKEGELYIKHCLDFKDWWGKVIGLHQNKDCVEFHIHNLLCCFPSVIEAIESAGEIAGLDEDEMQKRKVVLARKYDEEWNDPKLFYWRFGKQYLVPREICNRLESSWKADKWRLIEALEEKRSLLSATLTKNEHRIADLLIKKLNGSEQLNGKLFPSSILYGADYQVRRRLGGGSKYKEIQWLGESFVLRHFYGEVEPLNSELSTLLSLSHPNILQYLCGFYDEDKKECLLLMELMTKDLCSYLKENCSSRRRILLSLSVVVEIMLQIARGMEYLHSKKIYHGNLNPSNILLKVRNSTEGYFQVKVSGFGLSSVKNPSPRNSTNQNTDQNATDSCIWYAPEVLAEQEQLGSVTSFKYTEKADVYSFGMLCFELLTGKVPFEDGHLQGEKTSQNIRAGERPLFPIPSPKYLVNLTKKCWQTNPTQRPSFSSVCRILRSIKKFLVMNPDYVQDELLSPSVDFCDIEALFIKKFSAEEGGYPAPVSQIPFQMFAYKLAEKDKTCMIIKDKSWDPANDVALTLRDVSVVEDKLVPASDAGSVCIDVMPIPSETPVKKIPTTRKSGELKFRKSPGTPKITPRNSPAQSPMRTFGHTLKLNRGSKSPLVMSPIHPKFRGRSVSNS